MTARIPLLILVCATAALAEEKTLAQLIREETAGHKAVLTAKGKLSRYLAPEVSGVKGKCYVGVVKLKSGAKLRPFIQFVFQRAGATAYGGPGLHDDGTGGVFSACPSKSGPLKLQALLTTNPVTDLGEGSYEVTLYARPASRASGANSAPPGSRAAARGSTAAPAPPAADLTPT